MDTRGPTWIHGVPRDHPIPHNYISGGESLCTLLSLTTKSHTHLSDMDQIQLFWFLRSFVNTTKVVNTLFLARESARTSALHKSSVCPTANHTAPKSQQEATIPKDQQIIIIICTYVQLTCVLCVHTRTAAGTLLPKFHVPSCGTRREWSRSKKLVSWGKTWFLI
jgi:hypothetical protein